MMVHKFQDLDHALVTQGKATDPLGWLSPKNRLNKGHSNSRTTSLIVSQNGRVYTETRTTHLTIARPLLSSALGNASSRSRVPIAVRSVRSDFSGPVYFASNMESSFNSEDDPSLTSFSLIDRIRRHDPDAWSRLVHLYAPMVHQWCISAGCTESDAADVCQEVFQACFTSIDRFKKENKNDTFRGWLRVITANRVRKLFSAPSQKSTAEGGSVHAQRLQNLEEFERQQESPEEHAQLFRRAINLVQQDFEETTWKAFWRTAIDGCKAPFVAEELGMSATAVRKAKSRVLARLRLELGDPLQVDI